MDAGLLPVKRLDRAKSRLSSHLDAQQRRTLADALLADALRLCTSVDFVTWWVVSDDETVLAAARDAGLGAIDDGGADLNEALALGVAQVRDAGATSVTILPSDIPLAWRGDVQDLLETGATSDMVVVPARRDGGTNALYLEPPDLVEPRFGIGSLRAHVAAAEALSCRCSLLELPRVALDIDTMQDVDELLGRPRIEATETGRLLQRIRPAFQSL